MITNKSFYNFEKIEERGLFYFNFFNRNVQSKHVCQLAYNGIININARNLSSKQYSSESCCIEIKNGIVCGYVIGDEYCNIDEDGTVNWDWGWEGKEQYFNKQTFTSDLGNECSFQLLPEFQEQLNTTCIQILADSLAKKGYKHQAVIWCLFNTEQVPDNWELEFVGEVL